MKDNSQKGKISRIVSGLSVIISLLGVILALMNISVSINQEKSTWSAVTLLFSGIAVFLACTAQLIIIRNKYKALPKKE